MKKLVGLFTALFAVLFLAACGNGDEEATGATADSAADGEVQVVTVGVVGALQHQWEAVNEQLEDEGIQVELVYFSEWTAPNPALNYGETDLNAFQSRVFLENAIENNGYDLTEIGNTFVSPMLVFAGQADIPADPARDSLVDYVEDGSVVGVPGDTVNLGRALKVLEEAGLIELDPEVGFLGTTADITNFHVQLEFEYIEANVLPQLLPDLDIAVINAPPAVTAGLSARDSIFTEDALNNALADGLVNLIVARTEDADNPVFQRIVEAYQTQAVKDVFEEEFEGALLPAW